VFVCVCVWQIKTTVRLPQKACFYLCTAELRWLFSLNILTRKEEREESEVFKKATRV
jgi:hypothetical protein